MKSKLYCYPTYVDAREAFNSRVDFMERARELGDTLTANQTLLELRYISEIRRQDILYKFTYVPIKVSIDMERLGSFRGEMHLYALLNELKRQVEIATSHMYTFAAIAEEKDGTKNKGATGTGKPSDQVPQSGRTGAV